MTRESTTEFTSPLARGLSTPARVRIVGALVESREEELLPSDLAAQANVSKRTFHNHRDALVELGVMRKVDPDRGYPRYTLADSTVASLLVELNETLEVQFLELTEGVETAVENFTA